jgi:hypothetical protein
MSSVKKLAVPNAECALNHVRFGAAMHLILNYVEFRTNPEPYMVRGVVHGGMRKPPLFAMFPLTRKSS